jgi:hypothetical protein
MVFWETAGEAEGFAVSIASVDMERDDYSIIETCSEKSYSQPFE